MGGKNLRVPNLFFTVKLSCTKYPTANFYFNDVGTIHDQLVQWRQSDIDYIGLMAMLMQQKFDNY